MARKVVEEGRRTRLEFLADVASIEKLSDLSAGDRLNLEDRLCRLFPGVRKSRRARWSAIEDTHARMRWLIAHTVGRAGEPLAFETGGIIEPTMEVAQFDPETMEISVSYPHGEGAESPLEELRQIVRNGAKLPFRICPECERIFVWNTLRQRFHATECAERAKNRARRDQMRDYMRHYRAGLKKPKRR